MQGRRRLFLSLREVISGTSLWWQPGVDCDGGQVAFVPVGCHSVTVKYVGDEVFAHTEPCASKVFDVDDVKSSAALRKGIVGGSCC